MALYQFKHDPEYVTATRWFKNGDHPEDDVWRPFEDTGNKPTEPREGKVVRYYRHPKIDDDQPCPLCFQRMHDHGWIDKGSDGEMVCPGDWVMTLVDGGTFVVHSEDFERDFEPAHNGIRKAAKVVASKFYSDPRVYEAMPPEFQMAMKDLLRVVTAGKYTYIDKDGNEVVVGSIMDISPGAITTAPLSPPPESPTDYDPAALE